MWVFGTSVLLPGGLMCSGRKMARSAKERLTQAICHILQAGPSTSDAYMVPCTRSTSSTQERPSACLLDTRQHASWVGEIQEPSFGLIES